MAESENSFQVLSLDGGGIRGVFSAAILAAVEEDLGTSVADHFDLIAGTSTGGIIALGLGLGMRPQEVVEFYVRHGPAIFRDNLRLRSVQHWVRRKFRPEPLSRALRGVFGDRLLGDSTKRLVIPAYNLGEDDVYLFRTPHAERLRRDYRVPAWKVAMATTAAPTYFPAFRALDGLRLIDGGVWANNPALVALVEAVVTLKIPLDRVRVLSIGTYDPATRRSGRLDNAGKLGWVRDATVVDLVMRAQSTAANNHVGLLLGADRLMRINPVVPREDVALDRVRDTEALIARARHHSRRYMPTIQERFASHQAAPYMPIHGGKRE